MAESGAVDPLIPDKRLLALSAQASDINEARKALESATNIARGLWFTFLSLSAYLVITVGSVTHKDLFLQAPLKLPFLINTDLPLVTFFWVAPLLFLVVHAYLLLNLSFMGDNARHYFSEVDLTGIGAEEKKHLYLQLPNFIIMQMMIVRLRNNWGVMGVAIHIVVILTIVMGPIIVLLLVQLQFLPYHSANVTILHRLSLMADMGLIMLFWPKIVGQAKTSLIRGFRYAVLLLVFAIVLFSAFVATFPGEPFHRSSAVQRSGVADYLFHGEVNEVRGRRESLFSDTLVLLDADLVKAGSGQQTEGISISLRGRDLVGAALARSDLRRADFTSADLRNADFRNAKLGYATFGRPPSHLVGKKYVYLPRTNLDGANLSGADFSNANMRETSMQYAIINNATAVEAKLDGIDLRGATVNASDFEKASMRNANLLGAVFSGANLREVNLAGSNLSGALFLRGSLREARMDSLNASAPTLIDMNVYGVSDLKTDWSSTLVRNLTSTKTEFSVAKNEEIFRSAGLDSGVGGGSAAAVGVDAPDPEKKAEEIERKAVAYLGNGDIELEELSWSKRVSDLKALLCDNEFGVLVLKRLSGLPRAGNTEFIRFGPEEQELIAHFKSSSCNNSKELTAELDEQDKRLYASKQKKTPVQALK